MTTAAVTDIHGTRPTYLHFMVERLGANYVVVNRRTAQPKFDRRGFLQEQVTHGEYKAAERDYRALYGDPYDDVRAEMYRALKAADARFLRMYDNSEFDWNEPAWVAVRAALAAELARK